MTTDHGGPAARPTREVVLGEVGTRLLDASNPLPADEAAQLLDLVPGRRPVRSARPMQRVQSPDLGFGVDCQLRTGGGRTVRAVGVVAAHAVLTGGHVAQGSAYARVLAGAPTGRERWSHYAARRGVLEVVQKADVAALPDAYLDAPPAPDVLDLGAVGHHLLDRVQNRPLVDRGSRLKTQLGRLRWALAIREELPRPEAQVDLLEDGAFQIRLKARSADVVGVIRFCEDVARHAWLLAALTGAFERSLRRSDRWEELAPALEYLGHLWSPGAHLPPALHHLWDPIENGAQLSRAWQTQVTRVRDAISLLAARTLNETITKSGSW